MINEKILNDVSKERAAQIAKWGTQNHTWGDWMLILNEEVGEAAEEMLNNRFGPDRSHRINELRYEVVQAAAVAVSILDYIDREYADVLDENGGAMDAENALLDVVF